MIAAAADALRASGLGLALPGVCLAAGVLAFAATIHRGPFSEVVALARVAHVAALIGVLGAALEIAGVARLFGEGWTAALTDRAPAALLRLLGAGLIVIGLFEVPDTRRVADGERWLPSGAGVFAVIGAATAVASFAFDGHTVSRGPRAVHAAVDLVHVGAGSVVAGGVVALAIVAARRYRVGDDAPVADMVHAFGRVATVAFGAVAVGGAVMAVFVLDSFAALTDSPWGRRLLIKLAAVAVAVAVGAWHHVRPAAGRRLVRTLATEAAVLTAVLVVSSLLVRASPN